MSRKKPTPPAHVSVSYQHLYIRCGKPRCRCAAAPMSRLDARARRVAKVMRVMHGPYWYAFWEERGRKRSLYIGRTLKLLRPGDRVPRLEAPMDLDVVRAREDETRVRASASRDKMRALIASHTPLTPAEQRATDRDVVVYDGKSGQKKPARRLPVDQWDALRAAAMGGGTLTEEKRAARGIPLVAMQLLHRAGLVVFHGHYKGRKDPKRDAWMLTTEGRSALGAELDAINKELAR